MAKEYTISVRVVSRYNISDPERGMFTRPEFEAHLADMVAQGWRLMGQPQFTGMEGYLERPDAGFRLLMTWERGN